jgi:glycosyltransferase involved in cell wall biosynthesis
VPLLRERAKDAVVVLLGEGVSSERVRQAAASSKGAILAPGARPPREIAQWLAACDVFTLPSWMEGTPNVVLEALASGRPVVASNVGGIPDVVPQPDAGKLVAPKDAPALASALAETLERVRRGELAPDRIRALGPKSWEESADALFGVLESVR